MRDLLACRGIELNYLAGGTRDHQRLIRWVLNRLEGRNSARGAAGRVSAFDLAVGNVHRQQLVAIAQRNVGATRVVDHRAPRLFAGVDVDRFDDGFVDQVNDHDPVSIRIRDYSATRVR